MLNVYTQWADTNYSTQWCFEQFIQHRSMKRARDVYDQLLQLMERVEIEPVSSGGDDVPIRKTLTAGFFANSARLKRGGTYRIGKTKTDAAIHPSSALKDKLPKWIIYTELVFTTKEVSVGRCALACSSAQRLCCGGGAVHAQRQRHRSRLALGNGAARLHRAAIERRCQVKTTRVTKR